MTNTVTGATDTQAFAVDVAQVTGSCDILNLVLGPLHLDLLGLVIDLNQVVRTITAVPGAGNLLGNLLCAVTGILDGPAPLGAIAGLLDRILRIPRLAPRRNTHCPRRCQRASTTDTHDPRPPGTYPLSRAGGRPPSGNRTAVEGPSKKSVHKLSHRPTPSAPS